MGCMHKSIEQITSTEVENLLPKNIINLLWYIWETECYSKEVRFNLKKSKENKQIISVFSEDIELKSFTMTLDTPVTADVLITVPTNSFIMEIKK